MTTIREQCNAERVARLKRDTQICELYISGATLEECGRVFKLKRQRIKQIVKKAGVWRPRAIAQNDRDEFLGVNLSTSDKIALKVEAERRGISMSALTSELIKENVPPAPIDVEIQKREEELATMKEAQ